MKEGMVESSKSAPGLTQLLESFWEHETTLPSTRRGFCRRVNQPLQAGHQAEHASKQLESASWACHKVATRTSELTHSTPKMNQQELQVDRPSLILLAKA